MSMFLTIKITIIYLIESPEVGGWGEVQKLVMLLEFLRLSDWSCCCCNLSLPILFFWALSFSLSSGKSLRSKL